jgi:hypothetical protein
MGRLGVDAVKVFILSVNITARGFASKMLQLSKLLMHIGAAEERIIACIMIANFA